LRFDSKSKSARKAILCGYPLPIHKGGVSLGFLYCDHTLADRPNFGNLFGICYNPTMFNEEKVKNDLEKMRQAYRKALKTLEAVKARQAQIAESISKYKARNKNVSENQWAT